MPIQAWTSTLTSLATRRRKSPSPQTILENHIPSLRPTPLLHPLLLPLMSDLPHISLLACCYFIFLLGLGPMTYVAFSLMNIHFYLTTFASTCAIRSVLHEPNGPN